MITLVSTPQPLTLVANPVLFVLSMTGTDSSTETRRLGYQLLDASNNPISKREGFSPVDGQQIDLDFSRDIRNRIYTDTPQVCDQWDTRVESSMLIEVKLRYWEIVFNKETCDSTDENIVTTGTFKVLNSAEQWWGFVNTPAMGFHLLTFVPEYQDLCPKTCNLLYAYFPSAMNVIIVIYDRDSEGLVPLGNIVYNLQGVYSINISPLLFQQASIGSDFPYQLSDVKVIRVFMNSNLVATYNITGCCAKAKVAFQHFGGGYAYMFFDKIDEETTNTSFTEVCRWQPKNKAYSDPVRTKGGLSISNKQGKKLIKLSKSISKDQFRDKKYIEDFLSSSSYYIEFMEYSGLDAGFTTSYPRLMKFIVQAGSLKSYDSDNIYNLEVIGYVNQMHRLPNHE